MSKELENRLLIIASAGLMLAGIIFLCLAVFTETEDSTDLIPALFCILLASLFYIIRIMRNRENKQGD